MSNMKKLIESLDALNECPPGMDEGGMPMGSLPAPIDKGNPVTMNVSLNASGKEHVEDLINMMKNAGMSDAKEFGQDDMPALPMRMDMERLRDIVGEPGDEDTDEAYSPGDENAEGVVSNCCGAPVQDEREGTGRCSACGEGCEAVAEESIEEGGMKDQLIKAMEKIAADDSGDTLYKAMTKGAMGPDVQNYLQDMYDDVARDNGLHPDDDHDQIEEKMHELIAADYGMQEWANSPEGSEDDVDYRDQDYMTNMMGDDLHKKKKAYAAAQDGDNAMAVEAIKAQLMKALSEKKKPDANKNGIPDYAEDGKGPNDLAKGKKGGKPKKGKVPPQFKKK
jgi:hypothetical protein